MVSIPNEQNHYNYILKTAGLKQHVLSTERPKYSHSNSFFTVNFLKTLWKANRPNVSTELVRRFFSASPSRSSKAETTVRSHCNFSTHFFKFLQTIARLKRTIFSKIPRPHYQCCAYHLPKIQGHIMQPTHSFPHSPPPPGVLPGIELRKCSLRNRLKK